MTYDNVSSLVSPTREYEVHLVDENADKIVTHVTLPENLANFTQTVAMWFVKYIPDGCLLTHVVPFEPGIVEGEPNDETVYVGFGDELDYVGEDEPEPVDEEWNDDF